MTLNCAVLILGSCLLSSAHDLYLMPDSFEVPQGGAVSFSLYNGDAFPKATSRVFLDRLRNPKLHGKSAPALPEFTLDGTTRAFSTVNAATPGHLILTVETVVRTETMNGAEFLDYLKEENLTGVIDLREKTGEAGKEARERYAKYAKTIVRVGAGDGYFNQPTGLPIEFVPEKDPLALKPGEPLPVRLLFRGKPVPGIAVIASRSASGAPAIDSPAGATDADGRISIPLQGPGLWRLHAIHMLRSTDPSADWESFWATLTFESK